jgi:hypothetical protein
LIGRGLEIVGRLQYALRIIQLLLGRKIGVLVGAKRELLRDLQSQLRIAQDVRVYPECAPVSSGKPEPAGAAEDFLQAEHFFG